MIFQRIFQPRNPLFWLLLAVNGLSFAMAWIARRPDLNMLGMLLAGSFALGNTLLGMFLAWRLLRADAGKDDSDALK